MRNTPNLRAERYRIRTGLLASDVTFGNNGAFLIPQKAGPDLVVLASAATDLESLEALPACAGKKSQHRPATACSDSTPSVWTRHSRTSSRTTAE